MAGLIDVGNNVKSNALSGMRRLSDLELAREREEKQLDRQDEADHRSNQMAGASMGAAIGGTAAMGSAAMGATLGAWAGPVGMAIGAATGYLIGSLF
jgi:hypothetical protein